MVTEITQIIEEFSKESVAFDNAFIALDSCMEDIVNFLSSKVSRI
jgi:hypothetical protein